ncbi:MAG: hypothetical protein QOI47_787 [Actinomycetota bacterium]|nr:hypothetical protein [Actinomycetota bacterium]
MRRRLLIVLAVLAAALALPVAAQARSLKVVNADVSLRLATDASVVEDEHLTIDYSGSYNATYRDIPLSGGATIDPNSVTVREGKFDYRPGGCTTFGCIDARGTFGVTDIPDGNGVRIVWHPVVSDEQRTFDVSYRVNKAVDAYDDVLDVNARVWGDQWDFTLDHLTAYVVNPALDPGNPLYRVWGSPRSVEGTTVRGAGEAKLEASNVPAHQFVELRVTIPRTPGQNVSGAKTHSGNGLPAILKEEQGETADFNSTWNKTKRFVAHHAELLAGLITAALLLLLALMLWLAREHPTSAPKYVPEPPDDAGPALAYGLAHEGEDSNNTVLATLLDLVERGYYDTKTATTEDEKLDLSIAKSKKRPSAKLEPYEQDTLDFFDELVGDESVAMSEMKDKIPKHSATWRARWEKMTSSLNAADEGQLEWDRNLNPLSLLTAVIGGVLVGAICLIQNNVEHHWFVTAAIGAVGVAIVGFWPAGRLKRLAPQYRERSAKWESFQRWTDDFPRLDDDPPATLKLWKRILIYGVAFGTADRMIKSGRIPEPVLQSSDGSWTYGYFTGAYIGSSFNAGQFSSGFSSQVAPVSSSRGGVGVFSGGGGGGFGGGGGGGW